MKYKIQVNSLWGWSDLKTSEDGLNYEVEIFDRLKTANQELKSLIEELEESGDSYRVVDADLPQEVDLYQ